MKPPVRKRKRGRKKLGGKRSEGSQEKRKEAVYTLSQKSKWEKNDRTRTVSREISKSGKAKQKLEINTN